MTRTTTQLLALRRHTGFFPLAATTAAALIALTLSACGGGGGDSGSTGNTASVGGTASYSGTVTGLGSIVVNGVRFSTSGADTADGDDPSKAFTKPFGLGTTVTVTGSVDDATGTGTATSITVHGGARGQVSAVDTVNKTFEVAGQVIQVSSTTVFDGTSNGFGFDFIANAGTAVYVEAFGVLDAATGTLQATRIEEKTQLDVTAEGYAVRGLVSGLNTSTHVFDLTLRTGLIAHVAYVQDANVKPAASLLTDGAGVRIVMDATNAAALASATTGTVNVTASKVIVKREKQSDGVKAALIGAIKTISSDRKTWTIGDATVDVSQSPELHGVDLSTITVGTLVKVKGTFANGVLVAKEVSSKSYDDQHAEGVKLFGMVSAATAASGGTPASFVVQGVKVTIASTSSLTLPADGTYVEVKAQADANGVLTASEIQTQQQVSTVPRSFEIYGTASCTNGQSDLGGTFTMTLRDGSVSVDASAATFSASKGVTLIVSTTGSKTCLVEVTGALNTSTHVLTATKVEVKARDVLSNISLH